MTKAKVILIISSILATGLLGYFGVMAFLGNLQTVPTPNQEVVTKTVEQKVTQDPHLLAVLKSVGATHTSRLNLSYLTTKEVEGQRGAYNGNTVQVAQGLEPEQEKRTLAHEYLHYIWSKVMTASKRVDLNEKLETLLANDAAMQERIKRYIEIDKLNNSELFSIYCTESTDSYILPILDECNKYIDRSKLVLTR